MLSLACQASQSCACSPLATYCCLGLHRFNWESLSAHILYPKCMLTLSCSEMEMPSMKGIYHRCTRHQCHCLTALSLQHLVQIPKQEPALHFSVRQTLACVQNPGSS